MNYEPLRPYATPTQALLLDAILEAGSVRKAAARMGKKPRGAWDCIHRLKKEAARRGYCPEADMTKPTAPGFEIKGTSTLYNAQGQVTAQWVKTRQEDEARKALLEAFTDALVEKVDGKAQPVPAPRKLTDTALLSAYVVGDAHIGMYAWAKETGGEDFDTDIAANDLRGAFNHLVGAAPASEVGVLVNVGDLLHSNGPKNETEAGTRLDTDGRFARVVERAELVFHYAIGLMLKKHKRVLIVNARGNHDETAAMWINRILGAYYRKEPRVTILSNITPIAYVEWGKTLVGVNHGDKMKAEQLYEAMTRDNREAWGKAKHVYFWTGHIHIKRAQEIGGCLFESFNTLAPVDAWHAHQGYGGNREMQQITLHKEHGIVGRNVCGLAMARKAA